MPYKQVNLRNTRNWLWIPCLFVGTLLARIPFASRFLYCWDSVQFSLALERYDIQAHSPHPPGYFHFVLLGKAGHILFHDPNDAYLAVNILCSAFTVVFLYLLCRRMLGTLEAVSASLLLLTGPSFWFYGEVALSYAPEALFSILVAYFCWKSGRGGVRNLYVAGLFLGLGCGVRQSTFLFLFPLWVWQWRSVRWKHRMGASFLLVFCILSWLIPTVNSAGGLVQYWAILKGLSTGFVSFSSRLRTIAKVVLSCVWGVGAGGIGLLLLARQWRHISGVKRAPYSFLFIWILPGLMFYSSTHIAQAGYVLVLLPGVLILAARGLATLRERVDVSTKRWGGVLAILVLSNCAFYSFQSVAARIEILRRAMASMTILPVRDNDAALRTWMNYVVGTYRPEDTVFVSTGIRDPGMLYAPYRHFMYYLPEYSVYALDFREEAQERYISATGREQNCHSGLTIPVDPEVNQVVLFFTREGFTLGRSVIPDKLTSYLAAEEQEISISTRHLKRVDEVGDLSFYVFNMTGPFLEIHPYRFIKNQ